MNVYMAGLYPKEVIEAVNCNSGNREGMVVDRIQQFTKDEQSLIKGWYIIISAVAMA